MSPVGVTVTLPVKLGKVQKAPMPASMEEMKKAKFPRRQEKREGKGEGEENGGVSPTTAGKAHLRLLVESGGGGVEVSSGQSYTALLWAVATEQYRQRTKHLHVQTLSSLVRTTTPFATVLARCL